MIKGPFTLSELRRNGTKDLHKFIEFVENKNIDYWIDCGTLLGAIRQRRMLSWDGEFDISMWKKDFESFSNLIPDIQNLGFEIEYFRNDLECTNIKLVNKSSIIGVIPIDIHFYETDKITISRKYGPIPKNNILQIMISYFIFNSLIKRFSVESNERFYKIIKYHYHSFYKSLMRNFDRDEIDKRIVNRKFYFVSGKYKNAEDYRLVFSDFIIEGSFKDVLKRKNIKTMIKTFFASLPYSVLSKSNLFLKYIFNSCKIKSKKQIKFDYSVFSSFTKIPFEGIKVNAPEKPEACLKIKYGDDWRTPKPDWHNHDREKIPAWTFYNN